MERRLQQLLQMESLTPSQFADKMEIQRSGISHILSGRNKPSFDFISKLLDRFPSVNAEWLILGKGKPYKENNMPAEYAPVNQAPPADITPKTEKNVKNDLELTGLLFEESKEPTEITTEAPDIENNTLRKTPAQPSENKKSVQHEVTSTQKSQGKTIEKVIILYNDGTYEIKP